MRRRKEAFHVAFLTAWRPFRRSALAFKFIPLAARPSCLECTAPPRGWHEWGAGWLVAGVKGRLVAGVKGGLVR